MKTGFENNRYYIEYESAGRKIGTMREELNLAVKSISETSEDKLLISLSSGLDSQVIVHSFHEQGLPYTCAFLHMPGYNDNEYANVKVLQDKYKFKLLVRELDPAKEKDEILELAYANHTLPNNYMHKKFLSMLPEDMDFLNGLEGPDFVMNKQTKKKFVMDAYWNFENTRLRVLRELNNRSGKVLNIDKSETGDAFLASILNDAVVKGYVNSMEYIVNNDLVDGSGKKPAVIFNYNYYIKPIIMGRYWGEELIYFPKYMGVENVDWIMNCPIKSDYSNDVVYTDYSFLRKFLIKETKETVKCHARMPSSETIA
jgi:hypothetical protein